MLIPHTLQVRWQRTVLLDPRLEVFSRYLGHKVSDHFSTGHGQVYNIIGFWVHCFF